MSVRPPRRIGRYELVTELARGGMGMLYVARRSGVGGFEKLVAIKLMLPHLSGDANHVALFLNEARITAQLSHPNVCQVFEIEELDDQLVLVMEYLEGVTWDHLARVLPVDPIVRLRATACVVAQACEGLQRAHEHRGADGTPAPIIHRDISPQNLFVTVDGVCKVLDFGVAKMMTSSSTSRSGVLAGKASYMSPEQVRGERLDARSDVFSTGVVLWEALAQQRLFQRDAEFETLLAITSGTVDPVTTWVDSYGPDVDAVVQRALAIDREQRYGTIRALGGALREMSEAYGGAMTQRELGALVRKLCGAELEQRRREIAAAAGGLAEGSAAPASDAPTAATMDFGPTADGIALRAGSAVLGRPPSGTRWWVIALAATAALAVTVVVLGLARSPASPSAGATARTAPPALDAAAAPPPAIDATEPPPAARPETASPPARRPPPPTRRVSPARPLEAPPVTTDTRPGKLSVDARSVARVYVDGAFVDETPLYQYVLAPGRHELRLVPKIGAAKVMQVTIEPNAVLNLGTLP